jgi:hypothetical protein
LVGNAAALFISPRTFKAGELTAKEPAIDYRNLGSLEGNFRSRINNNNS